MNRVSRLFLRGFACAALTAFLFSVAGFSPLHALSVAGQTIDTSGSPDFQTVAPGVSHLQVVRGVASKDETTGPWLINMLRVDLRLADLRLVHAMDEGVGLETVSSMAARYGALAAVNSGYFRTTGTYRGDSIGVSLLNGKLISEPYNNRAAIGLMRKDNATELILGHLTFSGMIAANNATHIINGVNRPRAADELIVFTPEFHRTTLTTPDGVEAVIRRNKVVIIDSEHGSTGIPTDGFVLSAAGTARAWLLKNLKTGTHVKLALTLRPVEVENSKLWQGALAIVGGGPQLVRNGKIEISNEAEKITAEFVTTRHPRTAIAKLKSGEILLVTVDGRQPGISVGMSLNALADLLLEFGAVDAINLDGGGSTTMVVRDKVVNKPSDATGERPVSDAILVFSKPRQ